MVTSFNYAEIVKRDSVLVAKGNVTTGKVAENVPMASYTIASGATAETIFVPLDPTQVTSIHMSHNAGDTPTISATITVLPTDDLELATVNYFSVYDGSATPYAAADVRPLIGLKIVADPTAGAIEIDIIQTRRNR